MLLFNPPLLITPAQGKGAGNGWHVSFWCTSNDRAGGAHTAGPFLQPFICLSLHPCLPLANTAKSDMASAPTTCSRPWSHTKPSTSTSAALPAEGKCAALQLVKGQRQGRVAGCLHASFPHLRTSAGSGAHATPHTASSTGLPCLTAVHAPVAVSQALWLRGVARLGLCELDVVDGDACKTLYQDQVHRGAAQQKATAGAMRGRGHRGPQQRHPGHPVSPRLAVHLCFCR